MDNYGKWMNMDLIICASLLEMSWLLFDMCLGDTSKHCHPCGSCLTCQKKHDPNSNGSDWAIRIQIFPDPILVWVSNIFLFNTKIRFWPFLTHTQRMDMSHYVHIIYKSSQERVALWIGDINYMHCNLRYINGWSMRYFMLILRISFSSPQVSQDIGSLIKRCSSAPSNQSKPPRNTRVVSHLRRLDPAAAARLPISAALPLRGRKLLG